MKSYNAFKNISIIAYVFIFLKGDMIALPFICYLLFSLFDIGTIAQLYSFFALAGLIIILTQTQINKQTFICKILALGLLVLPLIGRLTSVPIELFNYSAFILPSIIFITCQIFSLVLLYKNLKY